MNRCSAGVTSLIIDGAKRLHSARSGHFAKIPVVYSECRNSLSPSEIHRMKFIVYPLAVTLITAMPSAFSQSKRYIDTEEQCREIHGTWAPSKYALRGQSITMMSCYVDMNPYGECRQAGGYNIDKAPDEIRCQLPQTDLGRMAQCREKLGLWAMTAQGFLCYPEATEQKCRKEGGRWEIGGIASLFYCYKTAIDGGKPCRDNSECQFGCRYEGPNPPQEKQVVGKCQSSNRSSFECYSDVVDGKYGGYRCP